jgi:molybdopterin/thiamine biosynthesis adenylyltransferase
MVRHVDPLLGTAHRRRAPTIPPGYFFDTVIAADIMAGRMLLLDGLSGRQRVIKLRPRRGDCTVCGDEPTQRG